MPAALLRIMIAALLPLFAVAADPVSYTKQVRPVLDERCVSCHKTSERFGGVSLERYDDVIDALIPGDPANSRLVVVVSGERRKMPRGGPPLTDPQVEILRLWVEQGAKDDSAGIAPKPIARWSSRPLLSSPSGHLRNVIETFRQVVAHDHNFIFATENSRHCSSVRSAQYRAAASKGASQSRRAPNEMRLSGSAALRCAADRRFPQATTCPSVCTARVKPGRSSCHSLIFSRSFVGISSRRTQDLRSIRTDVSSAGATACTVRCVVTTRAASFCHSGSGCFAP